jgi:hypothetical protein
MASWLEDVVPEIMRIGFGPILATIVPVVVVNAIVAPPNVVDKVNVVVEGTDAM